MKNAVFIIGIIAFILAAIFIFVSFQGRVTTVENDIVTTELSGLSSSDATVTFMTEGSVGSAELHRSIRITVSKDSRIIEILGGYQYIPIKSQHYPNTPEAFKPLLIALQNAGFMKKDNNSSISNPEGQCPLGKKYFFSSAGIPDAPKNLWSSTCTTSSLNTSSLGTFKGDFDTVQELFQDQIPDYSKIVSGVNLD